MSVGANQQLNKARLGNEDEDGKENMTMPQIGNNRMNKRVRANEEFMPLSYCKTQITDIPADR